jgi:hypothetical protein
MASTCPACGAAMEITGYACPQCETAVTGHFAPCRFCALGGKELHFIETFLRCRGSIKEVERALGLSYPTVRNLLDGALKALGLEEVEPTPAPIAAEARRQVLDLLERGEIDAREAAKRLASQKEETP